MDQTLAQQNSDKLTYLYQIFVLVCRAKKDLSSSGETFQAGRELSRVPLDHTLAQQFQISLPLPDFCPGQQSQERSEFL